MRCTFVVLMWVGVSMAVLNSGQEQSANRQQTAVSVTIENVEGSVAPVQQSETSEIGDWKKDEVCQMVFFAVLEGLYQDGVADDVVDSIIGPKSNLDDKALMLTRMKRSFVMDCALCQPTFEAFLTYQNRTQFNDGSGANNFGDGLDKKIRAGMLSDNTQTRLTALKVPVQKWVSKKLVAKDLSEEQQRQWTTQIGKRFDEGRGKLMTHQQSGKDYQGWSGYWGCAACNATRDANMQLKIEKK